MPGAQATKGLRGSVRRAVPIRYGITPEKIRRQLHLMVDTVTASDCSPTIGVTASNLDRHPKISADLAGLDLIVHGYQHVSYGALTEEEQARDLDQACLAFSVSGLRATGFRAPYLSTNAATLPILRERGFVFDSSSTCFALETQDKFQSTVLRHAEARYGRLKTTPEHPHLESDLVELPVSLPDDELLIDAMGFRNPERILSIFKSMLSNVAHRGSALVLQIHPERFGLCHAAIKKVLSEATDLGGWKTNLSLLGEWIRTRHGSPQPWPDGHAFAIAITGDLDALTIADFGRRLWPGIA